MGNSPLLLSEYSQSNIGSLGLKSDKLYESFKTFIDANSNTIKTYKSSISQFFKWLRDNGIAKPQRSDIVKYKEDLKAMGLKPTTISNYVIALKQFFKWTNSENRYHNVAEGVKLPKLDKSFKKDYLTASQANRVLEMIDRKDLIGLRDYAILLLMLTGGLRTIEVTRANFEDLTISGNSEILRIQGKGQEEKTSFVKIPGQVSEALRTYMKEAMGMVKEGGPLFIGLGDNTKGKRLSSDMVSRIVKNRMRQAGFDSHRLTAHSLRHTAITLALLGDVSLQEAKDFARHKDINTTLVYSHNLELESNRASQIIAETIFHSHKITFAGVEN